MSTQVRTRLDALLAIEEVLGAAAIDATGGIESCVNLVERDAVALHRLISFAVGSFTVSGANGAGRAPTFATFALGEGQIAFSSTPRRSLLVLTDPDIEVRTLKLLLHEVLADLADTDYQPAAPPTAPPVPIG